MLPPTRVWRRSERTVSPKVTTEHPRVSHTVFRQFNKPEFYLAAPVKHAGFFARGPLQTKGGRTRGALRLPQRERVVLARGRDHGAVELPRAREEVRPRAAHHRGALARDGVPVARRAVLGFIYRTGKEPIKRRPPDHHRAEESNNLKRQSLS
jgi:hypothetical protein